MKSNNNLNQNFINLKDDKVKIKKFELQKQIKQQRIFLNLNNRGLTKKVSSILEKNNNYKDNSNKINLQKILGQKKILSLGEQNKQKKDKKPSKFPSLFQ